MILGMPIWLFILLCIAAVLVFFLVVMPVLVWVWSLFYIGHAYKAAVNESNAVTRRMGRGGVRWG